MDQTITMVPNDSTIDDVESVNTTRSTAQSQSSPAPPAPQAPRVPPAPQASRVSQVPTSVIEDKVQEFDRPNPWTRVVYNKTKQYPYSFHIKLKIPSLNDYDNWKNIIPNLNFDPRTGELVIPSKDEASALAIANLISINFTGQLSLKDILEKNLIQVSIAKAQSYEVVQNKLREQILENLYGKSFSKVQNNFEQDLAKNSISYIDSTSDRNGKIDFTRETFQDTFKHFGSDHKGNDIEAFDGNDYSYL